MTAERIVKGHWRIVNGKHIWVMPYKRKEVKSASRGRRLR